MNRTIDSNEDCMHFTEFHVFCLKIFHIALKKLPDVSYSRRCLVDSVLSYNFDLKIREYFIDIC